MTCLRGGISGGIAASLELVQQARSHGVCELVAAHDPDAQALAGLQAAVGMGFTTTSFDELLATGVDFVVLAGDPSARLSQVRAAAAQGAHCLVTAPLAPDPAAASEMLAACAEAQVRLGVYVPEFQDPIVEQLRRMIAADWLGGVVAVQGILGDDTALHGTAPMAHPLVDLASRQVQLATWLTGRRVLSVTAQTTRSCSRDDDGAVATAVLRGNVACTFAASHATNVRAFAVHGTDGGMRLAGDRLWLLGRRPFHGPVFAYESPGHELTLARSDLAPRLAATAATTELVGRFARWVDDCDDYPCPGDEALAALQVAEAMQRAARSGCTATLEA